MSDHITEFLAHMAAHGFRPKGPFVADNKWHQAYYMDEKGSDCSGAYSLDLNPLDPKGVVFTRKNQTDKKGWRPERTKKLSKKEMKALKDAYEADQKKTEELNAKKHARISHWLTKWYKAVNAHPTDHPYLRRKGIDSHGIKLRVRGNELIIPLYGADGRIYSIQRITADGGKYLFTGGRKNSSYFPLAKKSEDLSIMLICEGFATAASVRQSTGLPVFCAIDSGNIGPVISALRTKYPLSKFVVCADNDAFTFEHGKKPQGINKDELLGDDPQWNDFRDAGLLYNTGIVSAHKAAAKIGGAFVCHPIFKELKHKPKDFNDLFLAEGSVIVNEQIQEAVKRVPAIAPESVNGDGDLPVSEQHPIDAPNSNDDYEGRDYSDFDPSYYEDLAENVDLWQGDFEMNFKVLGYNEGTYFYFPFKERQIVALSAAAHSMPNLFRLDNLNAWMKKFAGDGANEKKIVMYATNALMELAKARGVFKEEDRVRGCGAWIDEGRKILHCGDILYVDGVETKFDHLQSEYTYVAASRLMRPASEPLSNSEANALRKICEAVTWENKLSGSLLAGWLVIAPICGALTFRPHIYINGEAESGKSSVINKIIRPVLGKIAMKIDGGTTEPKIRELMGYDARPIVYDEAEKSQNMENVILLSRKASTGAVVGKYGQKMVQARYCFCFSAINPPVNKTADESRMSFMTIKKNRRPTAMQEYDALLEMIDKTITADFGSRLQTRTLENMATLFENIKTFERAARKVIKGARASELIGAMLAGLYLLSKTDVVTLEFAEEWIRQHDWSNHTIIEEETDPQRLVQFLSSCLLRYAAQGMNTKEISIGDLIDMVDKKKDDVADKLLRYNGIAVKDGRVHFANRAQGLDTLLKNTDWLKPTRMLHNLEGAEGFKIFYFASGVKTSGVSLPIKYFTGEIEQEALPLPKPEPEPINEEEIPF